MKNIINLYLMKIGVRSLLFRKAQYRSLFIVCVLGVAISLTAIFISSGMIRSMNEKAKIYYGGDFTFIRSLDQELQFYDYLNYEKKLESLIPDGAIVSARFDFDARHTSFYFEGAQALQKKIKGVDFEKEAALLSHLNFRAGGISDIKGTNGVIISAPIAKILNVQVGDSITFMIENINSETDTLDVVVKGIFQDSSVFGMYTSYMDFDFLKKAYGYPENYANRICVNYPDKNLTNKDFVSIQQKLENVFNMEPLVSNKDDFMDYVDYVDDEVFAIIPLEANLSEVDIMQKAMKVIITFICCILIAIIITGIGSTYRVIIMKRINEIGIYMAIGMKKKSITGILLFESLFLLIFGCVFGFVFSVIFSKILGLFNFSYIPAFDLFLENGNLVASFEYLTASLVILAVIVSTSFAVLYSILKSIKISPVKALASIE